MADVVIFDWNVARAIQYKPKNLVVPSLPVKIALQSDPVLLKAVAADPLLQQRMADLCKDEIVKAAGVIESQLAASDKGVAGKSAVEIQKTQKQLDEVTRLSVKAVADTAGRQVVALWEQLAKDRAEYRRYQIKSGIKVTLGVGGVALGAAGIAGAAVTGGASLALGIVATWRALVDLTKTFANLSKEAETVGKSVYGDMKKLQDAYKNAPATPATFGKVAAREVGATVANTFLQTEVKNVPKVKSNCDLWKSKLQGLRTTAHDLSKNLNEFLLQSETAQRHLASLPRHPTNATKISSALTKLTGLQQKVRGLVAKIPETHQRAENGMRAQEEAARGLDQLALKTPGWTATFDNALPIMVNLGLAAAGNTVGFMEASSTAEYVQSSIGLVNDIASTINDVSEAVT
jgi:hypothetical protein